MKVLSLFDGMSCGQIALDQLGIPVETYYASEIDKYAIQVTQANYPNTIQVGDVCNLNSKDFADVDLIMGGSPCQGFSFAGKQLAFDDPRSALFFEFIRLLKAIKPRYFLLENVRMKKEFLDIISQEVSKCYPEMAFGIEPILINSSLLSAQSRQRYYWTNIPNIQQPEDRGIVLRDILENDVGNELSDKAIVDKPKQVGMASDIKGHDILRRVYSPEGKSPTLNSMGGGNREPKVAIVNKKVNLKKYNDEIAINPRNFGGKGYVGTDEKSVALTQPSGNNATLVRVKEEEEPKVAVSSKRHEIIEKNLGDRITDETLIIGSSQKNAYLGKDKSSSLTEAMGKGGGHVPMVRGKDSVAVNEDLTWRKLSCLECERLQTVPDNYTNHVSNTQRYKMLGNGWTVEVIKHILKNVINNEK